MWGGDRSEWGQSQVGVSGEVHKLEWSGDMAFIWRGIGTLVEVVKNASRDQ